MKRNIFIFISLIVFISSIFGINYYLNKKPLIDQGKINALNYINEKYGFTPKIIDIRLEYKKIKKKNTNPTYTNELTGFVKIDFKYQKKVFRVYIDARDENNYGYDDYQYSNIKKELMKRIDNEIGISTYRDEVHYNDFNSEDIYKDGLIHNYYDGTNLEECIPNLKLLLQYTSNVNFIGINPRNFMNEDSLALLIEYDNIDVFESMKNNKLTYHIISDTLDEGIEYYSEYANKILSIANYETNLIEIDTHEYEDIYFKAHDDEGYVNLSIEPIDNKDKWNGTVIKDGIIITDTYEIITKNAEIYIYVPDYIVKTNRVYNDYYLAIQYDNKNEERYYDAIRLKKYDNYYVGKININNVLNIKFNIVGI